MSNICNTNNMDSHNIYAAHGENTEWERTHGTVDKGQKLYLDKGVQLGMMTGKGGLGMIVKARVKSRYTFYPIRLCRELVLWRWVIWCLQGMQGNSPERFE